MPRATLVTQIEKNLRDRISSGEYVAGAMLPARVALATEYGVAVGTIEQAIRRLTQCGLLRSENGRGTFISSSPSVDAVRYVQCTTEEASRPTKFSGRLGILSASRCWHSDGTYEEYGWNAEVVKAIEHFLSGTGGSSVYVELDKSIFEPDQVVAVAEQMLENGITRLIVVAVRGPKILEMAASKIAALDSPGVFVGGDDFRISMNQVYFDHRDAGHSAAAHLIRQGAHSIAFVSPFSDYWVAGRLAGVREAIDAEQKSVQLYEHVAPIAPGEVLKLDNWQDTTLEAIAYEYARREIDHGAAADGIVAANDVIARGYLRAAAGVGRVAGQDYLIIGFDDDDASRRIGLSTMKPPLDAMGIEAARLAIEMLRGNGPTRRVCMQSRLIARNSTSPIHQ